MSEKSIVELFIKPDNPDKLKIVYRLVLRLVNGKEEDSDKWLTKRVSFHLDSTTKKLNYFDCMVAKHCVIREVQVYDE